MLEARGQGAHRPGGRDSLGQVRPVCWGGFSSAMANTWCVEGDHNENDSLYRKGLHNYLCLLFQHETTGCSKVTLVTLVTPSIVLVCVHTELRHGRSNTITSSKSMFCGQHQPPAALSWAASVSMVNSLERTHKGPPWTFCRLLAVSPLKQAVC